MRNYIHLRGDIYYYRRRVPQHVMPYENRQFIKVSLGTKDKNEAIRKASLYNDYIEDYWRGLIKANGSDNPETAFKSAIKLAKAHGFAYKSVAEIAKAPLEDVVERVKAASKNIDSHETVAAVLGGKDHPQLMLSDCAEKFWPLSADRLVNKSEHQIRKWKNPASI